MYQYLDALAAKANRAWFFKDLRPLNQDELRSISTRWPDLPAEYITFLAERGAGPVEDGFHFNFLREPLDACLEVYKDRLILERGAKGPVLIFGHDQVDGSYGFDTGNQSVIVRADVYRQVNVIAGTFAQFLERLISEYPHPPKRA